MLLANKIAKHCADKGNEFKNLGRNTAETAPSAWSVCAIQGLPDEIFIDLRRSQTATLHAVGCYDDLRKLSVMVTVCARVSSD